jgi:excisionase family DNA binding protein
MTANGTIEELLTAKDVGAAWKRSERTIRRLAQKGEIPSLRIGGALRFSAGDLREFLARFAGALAFGWRPSQKRRAACTRGPHVRGVFVLATVGVDGPGQAAQTDRSEPNVRRELDLRL